MFSPFLQVDVDDLEVDAELLRDGADAKGVGREIGVVELHRRSPARFRRRPVYRKAERRIAHKSAIGAVTGPPRAQRPEATLCIPRRPGLISRPKEPRHGQVHHADRRRRADAARQHRHRRDHPEAVPEDDSSGAASARASSPRWRYNDDGSENPDFVLNKPAYRKAKIIVAGDNFGCGSSREHAPWALKDYGISCVISTSFADIFYTNCFQNGLLPAIVSPEDLEKLMDDASRGANATLTIDLEKQEIHGPDGGTVKFEIDPFKKYCLLNGLDGIGLTEQKADEIAAYEKKHQAERPWV